MPGEHLLSPADAGVGLERDTAEELQDLAGGALLSAGGEEERQPLLDFELRRLADHAVHGAD